MSASRSSRTTLVSISAPKDFVHYPCISGLRTPMKALHLDAGTSRCYGVQLCGSSRCEGALLKLAQRCFGVFPRGHNGPDVGNCEVSIIRTARATDKRSNELEEAKLGHRACESHTSARRPHLLLVLLLPSSTAWSPRVDILSIPSCYHVDGIHHANNIVEN